MANEVIFSGLSDLTLTAQMSAEYALLLADRTALPNHPALIYAGDASVGGSTTVKIPLVGLGGYDVLQGVADGADVTNTALTDSNISVTVARYAKAYGISDLAQMMSGGLLDPRLLALDALQSDAGAMIDLLADVVDGFTASVGSTGVNMDAEDFFEAIATLEIENVTGQLMSLLHPRQFGDLRVNLMTGITGGSLQFQTPDAATIAMLGNGYKGSFAGVDIFVSSRVNLNGGSTDRVGAMWGRGGVAWADASFTAPPLPGQAILAGKVMFEPERKAGQGITRWVSQGYKGASLGIQAAGVAIATDA